jgi:GDPmannose 4,6-dehydratase
MSSQGSTEGAPHALITGLSGQDGSFLAELLLERGYHVTGLVRPANSSLGCSEHLRGRVALAEGDLLAPPTLSAAIASARPREIYHLAAPSFVPASWEDPAAAMAAIPGSAAAILRAVRELDPSMRVFIAASGMMFGDAPQSPQREDTPFRPTTPYAIAKLAAHQLLGAMRSHDSLHASSGILFNHESERRRLEFVTRKVTRGVAAIALGLQSELVLGDLGAVRDWSFAGDIMHGAWLMLQQHVPDDYVLCSGTGHTVADFVNAAFARVDLDAERYVRVDRALVRAPEPVANVGDPSKARSQLGWEPRVSFHALVERMVSHDLRALEQGAS